MSFSSFHFASHCPALAGRVNVQSILYWFFCRRWRRPDRTKAGKWHLRSQNDQRCTRMKTRGVEHGDLNEIRPHIFISYQKKRMAQRLSQFRSNSSPIPGECGPFKKKRQFRSRHPHKTRLSQFRSNSGPIPGECGPFFKTGSFAPDILTKPGGPISVQFRSNSGPFWSIFRISTAWLCEPLSAPQMSVQSPSQRRSQVALAMVATMFASQLTLRDLEGRVVRFKEKVRVPEGRLSREASTSHPDCVCVAETEATVREHTIIARLARCVPRLALKGAWGAFVGAIEAVADQASACCLDFTVCFQRSKFDHPATLTEPRGSEFCCQMRGRGRGRKRSVFADLIVGDPSERANKHLRFDEPTAADIERSEVRNAAAKELEVVGLGRKSTCP